MNPRWQNFCRMLFALVSTAILTDGCTTRSAADLKAQSAFLLGQNMASQQQTQAAAQSQGVTVVGAVQNPNIPWVVGLTLAQAIATANYTGADEPKEIIIMRQGESATMDAKVLLDGTDIPLEKGDRIEMR